MIIANFTFLIRPNPHIISVESSELSCRIQHEVSLFQAVSGLQFCNYVLVVANNLPGRGVYQWRLAGCVYDLKRFVFGVEPHHSNVVEDFLGYCILNQERYHERQILRTHTVSFKLTANIEPLDSWPYVLLCTLDWRIRCELVLKTLRQHNLSFKSLHFGAAFLNHGPA